MEIRLQITILKNYTDMQEHKTLDHMTKLDSNKITYLPHHSLMIETSKTTTFDCKLYSRLPFNDVFLLLMATFRTYGFITYLRDVPMYLNT